MIDTHTHLYLEEFKEDAPEIIKDCDEKGVSLMILPNIDIDSIDKVKNFHVTYPHNTLMAMGLHPTEVDDNWEKALERIEEELKEGSYVAIGEVGMDLYWDKTYLDSQKQAFSYQLKLADRFRLPVIIHCREALDETLEIINEIKPSVTLVFHSFTGSAQDVKKIRQYCDPYFGINGVVTYKNAPELRNALREIGIERILLETDSPYLSPVPKRGKRNDSSNLIFIRNKVAEELGMSIEKVEEITDSNALKVFKR